MHVMKIQEQSHEQAKQMLQRALDAEVYAIKHQKVFFFVFSFVSLYNSDTSSIDGWYLIFIQLTGERQLLLRFLRFLKHFQMWNEYMTGSR